MTAYVVRVRLDDEGVLMSGEHVMYVGPFRERSRALTAAHAIRAEVRTRNPLTFMLDKTDEHGYAVHVDVVTVFQTTARAVIDELEPSWLDELFGHGFEDDYDMEGGER